MRDILSEIAASTAQTIGTEFLLALVRSMREAMDVQLVLITAGIGSPPRRARSVASWRRGSESSETIEYDLEGTPCKLVYEGETVVVSRRLYEQFPKEVGFEGYVGVPLRGPGGQALGHLAVISIRPLADPEQATAIARLFAMRAEAELQRAEQEREREALIASLTRANRRISRRYSELRKVNETKTMLLGMVAHDLRNPLATIVSRGELIGNLLGSEAKANGSTAKIKDSCEVIITAAERMDRLIASTLTQARSNAVLASLELHPCRVKQVIETAVEFNAEAARKKSISVKDLVDDDLMIEADEDRLVECLDNLIHNAIKYSGAGQAVTISAENGGGTLRIHVKDEGQGLEVEDLARAFRLFQRLSATPTGGESSTGIGLAIVKAIAEAHGGSVNVVSEGKGKGATFTVSLPHTVT
jgi:signal transduction histidine kinase